MTHWRWNCLSSFKKRGGQGGRGTQGGGGWWTRRQEGLRGRKEKGRVKMLWSLRREIKLDWEGGGGGGLREGKRAKTKPDAVVKVRNRRWWKAGWQVEKKKRRLQSDKLVQGGASLQHVVSCELRFCRRHTNRNYRFLSSLGPDWFCGLGQLNIPSTLQKPSQTGSVVFHFGIFLCEILYVDESKNSGPKKLFSTQKQEIHN